MFFQCNVIIHFSEKVWWCLPTKWAFCGTVISEKSLKLIILIKLTDSKNTKMWSKQLTMVGILYFQILLFCILGRVHDFISWFEYKKLRKCRLNEVLKVHSALWGNAFYINKCIMLSDRKLMKAPQRKAFSDSSRHLSGSFNGVGMKILASGKP